MWVVDPLAEKVYSYNMPRSSNADLRTLAVDGTEVSGFDFDTTSYVVDVGATVRQVTVSAEVRQLKATITSITPPTPTRPRKATRWTSTGQRPRWW